MNKKDNRTYKKLFWLSVVLLLLFTGSVSAMPWASSLRMAGSSTPLVVLGIGFWMTGILAAATLLCADRLRKRSVAVSGRLEERGRPGIFRFFQNPEAATVDVLLLLGIISFGTMRLYGKENAILFPAISILLTLLAVHSVLNGKNYQWIRCANCNSINKRSKKEHE